MGIEKRTYAFRLCPETHGMLRKIQEAFSPFCEDLSSTLRMVIRLVYSMLFTDTNLREALKLCQRLHRITSQAEIEQMQFRFPATFDMRPRFGGNHVQQL